MSATIVKKRWIIAICTPLLFIIAGYILSYVAYAQNWGNSTKAAQIIAIFVAEISLVLSAGAQLVYYLRIPEKPVFTILISKINWLIILQAIIFGLYLFLG